MTAPSDPGGGRVVASVFALGGGEILSKLVALVGTTYLAHVLTVEGMGMLGVALAVSSTVALAVSGGFADIGHREVARHPTHAPGLASGGTLVRLGAAVLAYGLLLLAVHLLDKPPVYQRVLLLTGLSFFSLALDTSWVHQGLERNRRVGLALVLRQVLHVALLLLAVRAPDDVTRAPVALFLAELIVFLWLARPLLDPRAALAEIRRALGIALAGGNILLQRLCRACILTFDVLLIDHILGERAAGLYSAPYRLCFVLLGVGAAIHVAYRPAFSRAGATDTGALQHLAGRALAFASSVAAPLTVGGIVLAAPLLDALFGAAYTEAVPAFRLLMLSVALPYLTGTLHNLFLTRGRLRAELGLKIAAAALNVALNLVLIPRHGLVGAAAATVAAEALILGGGLLALGRAGLRPSLLPALRPVPAALVMGTVLLLVGRGHALALDLALGAGVYLLALVLLGGMPADAPPVLQRLAGRGRRRPTPGA